MEVRVISLVTVQKQGQPSVKTGAVNDVRCFSCGGLGHLARSCPSKGSNQRGQPRGGVQGGRPGVAGGGANVSPSGGSGGVPKNPGVPASVEGAGRPRGPGSNSGSGSSAVPPGNSTGGQVGRVLRDDGGDFSSTVNVANDGAPPSDSGAWEVLPVQGYGRTDTRVQGVLSGDDWSEEVTFLVDTGADVSLLSKRLADRLSLAPAVEPGPVRLRGRLGTALKYTDGETRTCGLELLEGYRTSL